MLALGDGNYGSDHIIDVPEGATIGSGINPATAAPYEPVDVVAPLTSDLLQRRSRL